MSNRTKKNKPLTSFGDTLDAATLDSLPGARQVVAAAPPPKRTPPAKAQPRPTAAPAKADAKPEDLPASAGDTEETKKVTILVPKSLHKKMYFQCYENEISIQKHMIALIEASLSD